MSRESIARASLVISERQVGRVDNRQGMKSLAGEPLLERAGFPNIQLAPQVELFETPLEIVISISVFVDSKLR